MIDLYVRVELYEQLNSKWQGPNLFLIIIHFRNLIGVALDCLDENLKDQEWGNDVLFFSKNKQFVRCLMCNKPHPFKSIKKHLTTVHNMNPEQQQAALDSLESRDQGEIQPAR